MVKYFESKRRKGQYFFASIAFVHLLLHSKTFTSSPLKHKRRRKITTFRLNCKEIEREKPSREHIPISKLMLSI